VPLELYYVFQSLSSSYPVETLLILLMTLDSLHRMAWFVIFWFKLSRAMEGKNLSAMYIVFVALLLFGLSFVIAVLIDLYALPHTARLPGWTYVIENAEGLVDPLVNVVDNEYIENPANHTSSLNSTTGNSSTVG
jgi:hypothetical protein